MLHVEATHENTYLPTNCEAATCVDVLSQGLYDKKNDIAPYNYIPCFDIHKSGA